MRAITFGSTKHVPATRSVSSVGRPGAPDLRFGPLLATSVLVTTVVMLLGVGGPMWALTGQVWDGIGLGVFTAFWGGPGFGLMAAGAIWTARNERTT